MIVIIVDAVMVIDKHVHTQRAAPRRTLPLSVIFVVIKHDGDTRNQLMYGASLLTSSRTLYSCN